MGSHNSSAVKLARVPKPPRTLTSLANSRKAKSGSFVHRVVTPMRPVAFGEALPAGTRLTLFSDDKPDRFFTVIKFWMDKISGVALALKTGVPSYQVEDEEGRIHLLIHLAVEENNNRWYLWRPDHAGIDSRSIFEGALVET
jgi:hypothetical protein